MRLLREESLLVLVDPQERLVRVLWERERFVRRVVLLLRAAQELGIPVVATTQYRKGLGDYVEEVQEFLGKEFPLDKVTFNIFADFSVREHLESFHRKQLVFCGAEAHICIYQSVVGALEEGYQVWVAADATSSRSPEDWRLGLDHLRALGAAVVPTETIVYAWLERADTPAFKNLLPHLRG